MGRVAHTVLQHYRNQCNLRFDITLDKANATCAEVVAEGGICDSIKVRGKQFLRAFGQSSPRFSACLPVSRTACSEQESVTRVMDWALSRHWPFGPPKGPLILGIPHRYESYEDYGDPQ